jgi:hypothetical protein
MALEEVQEEVLGPCKLPGKKMKERKENENEGDGRHRRI